MLFFRIIKNIVRALENILSLPIIYMPNPLGNRLRYLYYRRKLKKCGKNVKIDVGVIIEGAGWISIGDNVWVDKYCIISAGPVDLSKSVIKWKQNNSFRYREGELIIGSNVHIGAFNILQSHMGVCIGSNVTTSAGVKIYSLSNYPHDEKHPGQTTYANVMGQNPAAISYIASPVVIADGTWIALNSIILGCTIGKKSFISSQSVVFEDIPENSYAKGNPAKRVRGRFDIKEGHA